MSPYFIALTITDILLLAVLVGSATRVAWWAKIAVILVVLSLNFLAWSSVNSGQGWAVKGLWPSDAQFVSCEVVEPKVIYVWVVPLKHDHGLLSYAPSGPEPRAYAAPYSRSLHEACDGAKKATGQGVTVGLRQSGHHGGGAVRGGRWHSYVLPSPHVPRKGGR